MIVLQEPILLQKLKQITEHEGIDANKFVLDAVRRHLAYYRQKRLQIETEAWYRLPREERLKYTGQFVAVYKETIVDHDENRLILYHRLQKRFGRQTILIIEGDDTPIPVYRIRSAKRGSYAV